jgi:oleate hydratase
MVGGGIGALAAAAFLIRDGHLSGQNIHILESGDVLGGSLDGSGDAELGYSMRGGRMFTTENYECTWALFETIPSIQSPGKSVSQETREFNQQHESKAGARLIDRHRAIVTVASMGFSMNDRMELLRLATADESNLGSSCVSDHLSPRFFRTHFWNMWATTFAFQPWHSATEFRRYLHRFLLEFSRIETLGGVKRTVYNQYDSLVRPLVHWLKAQGVQWRTNCQVTKIDHSTTHGLLGVNALQGSHNGQPMVQPIGANDLVFIQNGSMTDASSLGSMSGAPAKLGRADAQSWALWEQLAQASPYMGTPERFNNCIATSYWASFTVTLKTSLFFDAMEKLSGNEAGTGGLVTFKDSNWLMSIVLAHQPHFVNQPAHVQVFWGYALSPDRIGNFVAKPMSDCNGAEILQELLGHLRFDEPLLSGANCIPCRMPYITSMFMPRESGDRPRPVPQQTHHLALVSQFVEIPLDVVFTVEYSIRAAQMAVYELLGLSLPIPPVTANDQSLHNQFEALIKAFK